MGLPGSHITNANLTIRHNSILGACRGMRLVLLYNPLSKENAARYIQRCHAVFELGSNVAQVKFGFRLTLDICDVCQGAEEIDGGT